MIALYHGKSFMSRLIQFFNWSQYSHAAWIDDDGTCYHAWKGGVTHDPTADHRHTPGTPINLFAVKGETPEIRAAVRDFMQEQVGKGYDYLGILGFVIRAPGLARKTRWFCSELVSEAYTQAGLPLVKLPSNKVYPGLLATSAILRHTGGTRTS